ncbi:MAG: uroporphyrinogen decarboxylase [Rickettsiales bacterium]|nr:uroporphyrinogen decarboxylase [Rickettsiales bacterium]RPG13651.1 MAG: uroporphyrinogen decarboxylase [Pelagibacteraceae bacterium TMED195]|tara:strand:- start:2157 stop:3170 length:1014 start_codon:yes stop_codon:yes gene_type:complete
MDKLFSQTKVPVWFMRQAGRYLPEYKKLRSTERTFLDLCFNSEKAAQISLQPIERFDLDFIILFSDILVVPHALGQFVDFKENIGPILKPINNKHDLSHNNLTSNLKILDPIFKTIKLIKNKNKKKNVIGFCGGPFTVLTYMIEGGTSKDHQKVKLKIKNEKKELLEVIEILIEFSSMYLIEQIKSGANIVKIFESWAGLLEGDEYVDFIIEPNKKILKNIKKVFPNIPVACFPRKSESQICKFLENVECDIISLDEKFPEELLEIAKKKNIIVQGNLNPEILVRGGKEMKETIKKILLRFNGNKHIFNLSHGVLPHTPIANVEKTIQLIRDFNEAR